MSYEEVGNANGIALRLSKDILSLIANAKRLMTSSAWKPKRWAPIKVLVLDSTNTLNPEWFNAALLVVSQLLVSAVLTPNSIPMDLAWFSVRPTEARGGEVKTTDGMPL